MQKILVTGGSGMVGKNLIEFLQTSSDYQIFSPTRKEFDLLNQNQVNLYLQNLSPDIVIHCAGLVGGIQANINKPYSFLYENIMMGANIINASSNNNIRKLINLGSSCIYPKDCNTELNEDSILSGKLEPTNEGYALAKISVGKLCQFIKKEKKLNYKTLIPCNLYGKWDNFDSEKSHMIPAAIKKIHNAKLNKSVPVIWGDGMSRREFMYVEDLCSFIKFSLSNYDDLDDYTNVGLGYDYSIKEYYEIISKVIGYDGKFSFDLDKPKGMNKKLCSIKKQTKMGWKPTVSIEEGIRLTYNFYKENHEI